MSKFNVGDTVQSNFGINPSKTPVVIAAVSVERNGLYYIPYEKGIFPTAEEVTTYGLDPEIRYRIVYEPCLVAV